MLTLHRERSIDKNYQEQTYFSATSKVQVKIDYFNIGGKGFRNFVQHENLSSFTEGIQFIRVDDNCSL